MKAFFAASLIAVLVTHVEAQEKTAPTDLSGETIPDILPNYCTNLANFVGGNALIKDGCIEGERDYKAKVERMWPDIPKDARKQCVALNNMATGGHTKAWPDAWRYTSWAFTSEAILGSPHARWKGPPNDRAAARRLLFKIFSLP